MPYINNKYTSRVVTGSGKFKIGDKVRISCREFSKSLDGKMGIVVGDMFCGVYDYEVQIPEMSIYYMYENELIFADNALQRLKIRYEKV